MIAATLAIELLLMTCIGIFTAKMKIVTANFSGQLTNFLMKIALPCLIYISITSNEFSLDALRNCFVALVMGAVVILLSLLIGHIFYLISVKSGFGRVMRYAMTFTHFSFMGIPIVDALFGATGNLYYVMFLVPVRIFYYVLTPQLFGVPDSDKKKSIGQTLKTIFNPCLCAVVVGLVFWICGWQLPTIIQYCVKSLNSICSPLALLLCGMVIGEYDFKKLLHLEYLVLPLLRTVAMPALLFGVSRLLLLAGVDELLCNMLVVYGALPTSSLLPVYAMKYDPDPENHLRAAGVSMISVLISAFTSPVWYLLLQ